MLNQMDECVTSDMEDGWNFAEIEEALYAEGRQRSKEKERLIEEAVSNAPEANDSIATTVVNPITGSEVYVPRTEVGTWVDLSSSFCATHKEVANALGIPSHIAHGDRHINGFGGNFR